MPTFNHHVAVQTGDDVSSTQFFKSLIISIESQDRTKYKNFKIKAHNLKINTTITYLELALTKTASLTNTSAINGSRLNKVYKQVNTRLPTLNLNEIGNGVHSPPDHIIITTTYNTSS